MWLLPDVMFYWKQLLGLRILPFNQSGIPGRLIIRKSENKDILNDLVKYNEVELLWIPAKYKTIWELRKRQSD